MMPGSSLIALWTLGSAGMLLWGLAAVIPLLLHLWSRRRFQETSWGAMSFLLAAMRKNARRVRLEQLLLLAVRIALLALFAMALAHPLLLWRAADGSDATPSQTHYILVVDTSYSMAFRPRDRTRLNAAQDAIETLLHDSQQGDGFSLLLMQDPPQPLIAEVSFDRNEVRQRLEKVEVSQGGADLHATLVATENLIEYTRRRYPRIERVRIVFLTDFGQTTWDAAASTDCRDLFEKLGNEAELSLINVAAASSPNLVISHLHCDRPFVTVGETVRIEAEIQAFETQQATPTRIEFLVDGRIVDAQDLTVPVNGRAVATTTYPCDVIGDLAFEARLAADSLSMDNQRWLIVPVRKSLNVLCVQGEPDAAECVALALNPTDSVESAMHVEVVAESALLDRPLDRYECVFLNNVARIGFDEANVLHRYVMRGGGLVVALGDLVRADSYNGELGEQAGPRRVLAAHLEQQIHDDMRFFNPGEYQHPLISPFRGHERSGLLTVPTWRYFRLRPYASKSVQVALAFDNGDPAIVVESIGRGRSILVATALSPTSWYRTPEGVFPWTLLPTWPSFPPLVHGLVREATAGRETSRNIMVSAPLEIICDEPPATSAQVTLPDGATERVSFSVADNTTQATFAATNQRGIYGVDFPASEATRQRFAANLDPRESNLAPSQPESLPPELRSHASVESSAAVRPDRSGLPLFRHLLGAVAVLLLTESGLACWFARRRA